MAEELLTRHIGPALVTAIERHEEESAAPRKPTIFPTLVIGLGGTGTNVARYVKRRFLRTYGGDQLQDLPRLLQVLAVDTEPLVNGPEEEPLYFHEFGFLGNFDATRLVQFKANHPYLNWWQWSAGEIPLGFIHAGARQLRPIGRLAFFRNYVTFKKMLVDKVAGMAEQRAIQQAQERGFNVGTSQRLIYVVSSVCGGTGAGMLIDVAHRVRHEVGSGTTVIAILLMPSVFASEIRSDLQRRRIQANAFAALTELNHFQTVQDFSVRYPSEQTDIPTVRHRPFNQVFLLERLNTDGRSLDKSQVEQMAAHLIHLTAFSHLNSKILGLDVNITQERRSNAPGPKYLSYSSFGVSAIVMPRTTLVRAFRHRAAQSALEMLRGDGFDQYAAENDHAGLRDQIKNEFLRNVRTPQDAEELKRALAEDGRRWAGFRELVANDAAQILARRGLQGLRWVFERFSLAPDDSELREDDLAHPRQTPAGEPPPEVSETLWQRFFGSPEEREDRDKQRQRRELTVALRDTWPQLLSKIQGLTRDWLERIDELLAEAQEGMERAQEAADAEEARLDPFERDGTVDTNTYYDLETGALGRSELNAYIDTVYDVLEDPEAGDGTSTPREILAQALCARLMPDDSVELAECTESDIRRWIDEELIENPGLARLGERLAQAFDVTKLTAAQVRGRYRPPNFRVDQLFQRMAPHATVDGDTHPYSEADQEPIQAVGAPIDPRGTTDGAGARVFRQAMLGYQQFRPVTTGDGDRMDAVHIIHGLPLAQLACMPDLADQYQAPDFDPRVLHVHPEWVRWSDWLRRDEDGPSGAPAPPGGPKTSGPTVIADPRGNSEGDAGRSEEDDSAAGRL